MAPMTNFWQEYKVRLRSYIAKRVRESDAVDDILQEVFLKAHASLPKLFRHKNGDGLDYLKMRDD